MADITRRAFTATVLTAAVGPSSVAARPQSGRRLRVGHTGITWGFAPRDAERAIREIGSLGFWGYESFGSVLAAWDATYGLERILEASGVALRSAYCPVNLTDAGLRAGEVKKVAAWARLIRTLGGTVAVIGPNGVDRASFDFAATRGAIVSALNDMGRACMDIGVVPVLHPHTGTCVESRDETYATLEAMDTRYVKFGPDVGQLQKGGADPVVVCTDFSSIIHHVHMKDFNAGPDWLGYCPLGRGRVDVESLAGIFEAAGRDLMIMVELDPNENDPATGRPRPAPLTAIETARIARDYMHRIGYAFRV